MLSALPRISDPNVLVGFETSDDSGVYKLSPECALVQTVDFFTPIVDDPFTFGAIAAANSLSDVYAMGGRPLTALSILCYPGKGDIEDLSEILKGGASKMAEAGCVVLGGHSVNDEEIKFGYSITGLVHPDRVWTNSGAQPGDILFFTKRIGTGVLATALKRGEARDEDINESIASMTTLNKTAVEAFENVTVHACTDVTGFGLLGHAREMAAGSGVTIEIESEAVQFLPGAIHCARRGAIPGGLKNNREFVESCVELRRELPEEIYQLLYDPQTSGGLLISVPEAEASQVPAVAYPVGRVLTRGAKPLIVL